MPFSVVRAGKINTPTPHPPILRRNLFQARTSIMVGSLNSVSLGKRRPSYVDGELD
jgi:hypothetical protein